jgi:hypothetical protein
VDFFRPRAIQALTFLFCAAAIAAHADCAGINGNYKDESLEKVDGAPLTLSSFASPKERSRLVRQESTGSKPTFGGTGQVMTRPKTVKLVTTVTIRYSTELNLRYLDASGALLVEAARTSPTRWKCVAGRLERKFKTMSGLGDVMRGEEIEQVLMAAPGGDLVFTETTTVVEGPKAPQKRTEAHFKRVEKA